MQNYNINHKCNYRDKSCMFQRVGRHRRVNSTVLSVSRKSSLSSIRIICATTTDTDILILMTSSFFVLDPYAKS